jgi:hypothetical protein
MAETSLGLFFFLFSFFNKRELGGWYLLVEEIMAMRHVILTKRETHVGVEREITGHRMRKPKKIK